MAYKNEIYIVVAYRWGERSNHSYTVGAFTKKQAAINCAESHANYRGGKYSCVVEGLPLDHFNNDADSYHREIHVADGVKFKG